MKKFIQYITLKHLVLLSFVLNFTMYCGIHSWRKDVEKNIILTSDATGYQTLAENILHYHDFVGQYDTAALNPNSYLTQPVNLIYNFDTYREPGYPLFLAMVYFVAGVKPFIAIFLQIILNSVSVILVYKIASLLFKNNVVAILAGFLFAVDIHAIYVANTLYSDTLFIFLFMFFLYYFISGLQRKSIFKILVSALFLGITCLTRPVSLLYPFVLMFILLVFHRSMWRWLVKAMAVFMVITYSIVGMWVVRNHATYRKWQVNTMAGYNLMLFNAAFTESRKSGLSIEAVRAKFEAQCDSLGCLKMKNPFDRSALCGKVAWEYINKNKIAYIETQIWGSIHMFLSLGNIDIAKTLGWQNSDVEGQLIMDSQRLKQNFASKGQTILAILIILVLLFQYTGLIAGFIFLIKNKKYKILTWVVLTILYFTAITGAIGKYRYKLPMEIVICTIGGYGYYLLMKHTKES